MKAVICGAALTMAISLPTVAQEELKGVMPKRLLLSSKLNTPQYKVIKSALMD